MYGLDLHPTIDVLVTCSRDSTDRIWDVRTKASVHTLSDHTNAVATVRCQAAEPQIITGSYDKTIKLWDLVAGKTRVTLTNNEKSVRAVFLHPRHYTFASGSPDNIKQRKFPDGGFIQNLSGHNAIINTLSVNADGVFYLELTMALCTFGTGELPTTFSKYTQLYNVGLWIANQEYLLVLLISQKYCACMYICRPEEGTRSYYRWL
ncbi:pleiotropic regulator 1-like protein [Cricetulus griseus]|uniref:Pleiotropic regulator 1-like protein n=1 Tax=Cricetulus griseus TaxID=10029 RepID=A0A061I214_CRIGR|nr:pleiotropic regulator 1-like protein [Cricetulus griseus]